MPVKWLTGSNFTSEKSQEKALQHLKRRGGFFIIHALSNPGKRMGKSVKLVGRRYKRAGVRYRNPYQTRHTYASMLLSAGENMLWVAKQMGHRDTEMLIKTYGKWIPNTQVEGGYTPLNDWGKDFQSCGGGGN